MSASAFPFEVVVAYDFEGAGDGEMSVAAGDALTVTGEAEGGWYICSNAADDTGYVPVGYVERVEAGEGDKTQENVKSPKKRKDGSLKKRVSKKKLDSNDVTKSPSDKPKKKKERSKDGATEEKKTKKTKKSSASSASESETPSATPKKDDTANISPSTSPRALPIPTSTGISQSVQISPRSPRFDSQSPAAAEYQPESSSSGPSTSPSAGAYKRPTSPTPNSTGQNGNYLNSPSSTSSPTSPGNIDRKTPPAVPLKRIVSTDPNRGPPKTGADGPIPPNRPAFLSDGSERPSTAKVGVPMPPPRGTRLGSGPPPLPHTASSPRLGAPTLASISENSTTMGLSSSGSVLNDGIGGTKGGSLGNSASSLSARSLSPSGSHSRLSSLNGNNQDKLPGIDKGNLASLAGSGDSISSGMVSSRSMSSIPTRSFDDAKDQRRYFIVCEMLTTERTFVSGLEEGVVKYLRPLLEAAKTKAPQCVDDVKTIFSVMEHLLPLNQNLMQSIEERVMSWSSSARIGDVFFKFAPFLKMYTTYSNNYDDALQTLAKLAHDPFFIEMGIGHRSIENIIITPIQRIPRYSLLLSDLYANTNPDHVDYGDIGKSLAVIKDVADHVNKGVGIYKNVARLSEAGLAHLLAPHRTLVKDGTITVVKASTEKKSLFSLGDRSELKKHSWHFLLFSDALVFLNVALDENLLPKKEKKATFRLKLDSKPKDRKETVIPLYLTWLVDPGLRTGFDLIGPHQTMHLYFSSAAERDEWWQTLDSQIRFTLEKSDQLADPKAPSPATSQLHRRGRHYFTPTDWYDGNWESGKIHGKGCMTCTGATYEGVFDGSFENGTGTISYPTGMHYSGEWKAGKPHSPTPTSPPSGAPPTPCVMVYPSGETYTGEFKDGKRVGKGVLKYKDGSTLDVEWRNDLPHGNGVLTTKSYTYTGPFVEGKFVGAGSMVYGPKARYDGAFRDNLRHGRGKMIYDDGSIYEGEWKDDLHHGSGKWQNSDHTTHYEGEFKMGVKDGRGLMKWASGDEYIGGFLNGRPHGSGVFTFIASPVYAKYDGEIAHGKKQGKGVATFTSGARYEGDWADDLQHGNGKLTLPNGVTIEGRWVNGVADPKNMVAIQGAPIIASPPSDYILPFPQTSEVPLIPSFDSLASVLRPDPQ